MIVPLVARGRVLGALTFLSTQEGRHYTPGDLAFTETLAARSLRLLDTLFSTAPVGLAFLDAEQRYVRVNEAFAAMNGLPVDEHIGRPLQEVLGPSGADLVEIHREVLRTRRPVLNHETTRPGPGRPDQVRHVVASHTPVITRDGQLLGVGVAVIDITERRKLLEAERRARARADELAQAEREARARADFLARAGSILDSSLDYEETLANVARIAVPEIADWCAVSVVDEAGDVRQVAAAHVDPVQRALAGEISRRYPPDPDSPTGAIAVARSGVTAVIRRITDEMLVE